MKRENDIAPPLVRVCQHCGVTLTREWDDELCVCGNPVPEKETPNRIRIAVSQQKRGMGPTKQDARYMRERRANMTEADRDRERRARAERRKRQALRKAQADEQRSDPT